MFTTIGQSYVAEESYYFRSGEVMQLTSFESPASQPLSGARRSMGPGIAFLVVAAFQLAIIPGAYGKEGPAIEPVEHLNEAFHVLYAAARDETLLEAGPIFIVEGAKLVLVNKGERSEYSFRPEQYDVLKTVAHTPLAIYVYLQIQTGEELSPAAKKRLKDFQQLIETARLSVDKYGLSREVVERQLTVLNRSAEFTDKVCSQAKVSEKELNGFVAGLRKEIGANVWEATEMEMSGLNKAVQKVKSGMNEDDWSRLHVVVMGSPMARKKARVVQYFDALLGSSDTVPRVIYHEGAPHEADALHHMATYILDGHIGTAFFSDPVRMYSDLLGPDASRYLEEHPVSK